MATYIGTINNDSVDYSAGYDVMYGLDGNDVLSSDLAAAVIEGGRGDDDLRLVGSGASGHLYGGDGADLLVGAGGLDVLYAGEGDDYLDPVHSRPSPPWSA